MVLLGITFKPDTSIKWAAEKLEELGLKQCVSSLHSNLDFVFIANLTGFCALVQVSKENERSITNQIRLISPQVSKVFRLD